jgi:hypothetical protein
VTLVLTRPETPERLYARSSDANPSGARYLLFAMICGVVTVAAIKLAQLWLAQAPILDFSL